MTLFTPIGSADVIYLENSNPFDAADASSRSASGGAGDDTFYLDTFTEKIQIFNQII